MSQTFICVVSPAKGMIQAEPFDDGLTTPIFVREAQQIREALLALGYEGCHTLWKCSDTLARLNWDRLHTMDIAGNTHELSPAVLSYDGIQYRHLAAGVMNKKCLTWIDQHLRIISGMYGLLRPNDGVDLYRLEMQARLSVGDSHNLYDFWGTRILRQLALDKVETVVNLASVEYARVLTCGSKKLSCPRLITCSFGTVRDGRLVQRATEAKTARGTFVRWCAEQQISEIDELTRFSELGYSLVSELSDENHLVFAHAV